MHVLGRMLEAVKPGGLILDLQVIRPDPQVELNGCVVAEIDGDPLFRWADAATAAVDARIEAGDLVEEAWDDHEVCKHYSDGAELVEDVAGSKRRFPEEVVPRLAAITDAGADARELPPPATAGLLTTRAAPAHGCSPSPRLGSACRQISAGTDAEYRCGCEQTSKGVRVAQGRAVAARRTLVRGDDCRQRRRERNSLRA